MAPGKRNAASRSHASAKPKAHKVPQRKNNYTFQQDKSGRQSKVEFTVTHHRRTLKVVIFGIPRPLYRALRKEYKQPNANGSTNHWYNPIPDDKNSFIRSLLAALKVCRPKFSLSDTSVNPLSVTMKFMFPRPKAHYTQLPPQMEYVLPSVPPPPTYVTKVPDIDNLTKLVLDACSKNLFPDDAAVAESKAVKVWWAPHPSKYTEGQDKQGYTILKVEQIIAGTTEEGCLCEQCKVLRRR